jgi:AcrR family transcriptional regulator
MSSHDKAIEQRRRLVTAISRVAAERGYADLTVDRVVDLAGLSEADFYRHFASKQQGLIAAFEAFLERLSGEVVQTSVADASWPENLRKSVAAVLDYIAEANDLARVLAVEVAASSLAGTQAQLAALEVFAGQLRSGRDIYPDASELPGPTERVLVGGIASIIAGHLLAEEASALPGLEPDLSELLLVPFLGRAEARLFVRG